jgi:ADP-heptose:LPS heptosyltransferase
MPAVRVETMRAVDRALGRPLAWGMTLLRRLLPEPRRPTPAEVRKVLFVKLSEMGALVLAAPAFAEAERLFPQAERWLLCFEESTEIAEVAGGFASGRIVAPPSKGGLVRVLGGLLGALRRVRRERFDVVIDLEYFSRVSALLCYLSRAPIRSGFHRFAAEGLYCGDLYTHRSTFNPYLHISRSMVALVRASAADPQALPLLKDAVPELAELEFPSYLPSDEDRERVRAKLAEAGVPADAPVLLVNPNSSDLLPLRRWPTDRFAEVCRLLLEARPEAWVVLTGAKHELAVGEEILAQHARGGGPERLVSLIGKTSLRDLMTLFTLASVLVSADSGPPHFAALTRIRGVTLFGPETPLLYGPVTERNEAIWLGLACSPCISAWNNRVSTCTDNQCMRRIEAARVAEAALRQARAG